MLEGTMGVAESRTGGARSERPWAERHPGPGPRRGELLARLAAMSLEAAERPREGDPQAETEALAVARAWLDLIDNGRYAVGFKYAWNEERQEFMHAAGIFMITSEGVISQTILGLAFEEKTLRLGLVEASRRFGRDHREIVSFPASAMPSDPEARFRALFEPM